MSSNGIGSSNSSASNFMNSIEPNSPGSPSAPANYTWDAYASGQFPLALQAKQRGLPYVYADAWSAPGYMKTNNDTNNGGYLCGVSNTSCATGDWKQAYADYLVRNWQYYSAGGVNITHLGFLNEPSFAPAYASMQSNGTQAAEFIKVLGQTLEREGIDVKLTCCDDYGWEQQEALMAGLQAKGADGKSGEDYLSVITAHGYASPPNFTLSTTKKVWQSEWADLNGQPRWTPYSFYNVSGQGEGLTWAGRIQTAFTHANVSGFLYWIGAENATSNSALITTLGDSIYPSKRFWTFAQFSKFVRPGARRVWAKSDNQLLTATAFHNMDGRVAVQVLNNDTTPYYVDTTIPGSGGWNKPSCVIPYVTNNENDLAQWDEIKVGDDGSFRGYVPARSLVSWVG